MTIKQRIISYLQNHPEGIDDDELARALERDQKRTSRIKPIQEHCDRTKIKKGFTRFWIAVVAANNYSPQQPLASRPRNRALHHPSLRNDRTSRLSRRFFNDIQAYRRVLLHPFI